jgi:KaiC/GvpD/RAD55 family RecA-like ATPase
MVSDNDIIARVNSIVQPYMFDRQFRNAVSFIKEHVQEYNSMPTIEQIEASADIKLEKVEEFNARHVEWFMDEFETFCRHKALEKAILDSTDLLESKDYGTVEVKIKEASQIGLVKDLGLDYYDNPKERLEWIKNQAGAISTGWQAMDRKLYGGLNRGELTFFAGGSGAGKSLFLQNLALNWSQSGLNTVLISLELSEQLCSMRLDSMISGYGTSEVMKNIDDVDLKVRTKGKGAGKLRVKQLTNGVTSNDIQAFLREYEIQSGVQVDAVIIDYLDLMMPVSNKVNPGDLFIKDKYVSEELRNLAVEWNVLMVTASQLNRGAVEEIEFDHHHIAGGISKIQTADNVIGIFTSNAMRERGRYQLQFMKTRSSSGVGTKIDLKFVPETLRIEDLDEGDEDTDTMVAGSLINSLKRSSSIKDEISPDHTEESGDIIAQGSMLKDFLKKKS